VTFGRKRNLAERHLVNYLAEKENWPKDFWLKICLKDIFGQLAD
jgi:hypothetical protein